MPFGRLLFVPKRFHHAFGMSSALLTIRIEEPLQGFGMLHARFELKQ